MVFFGIKLYFTKTTSNKFKKNKLYEIDQKIVHLSFFPIKIPSMTISIVLIELILILFNSFDSLKWWFRMIWIERTLMLRIFWVLNITPNSIRSNGNIVNVIDGSRALFETAQFATTISPVQFAGADFVNYHFVIFCHCSCHCRLCMPKWPGSQ